MNQHKPLEHSLSALLFLSLACAVTVTAAEKIPVTTTSQDAREQFIAGRTLVDNLRLTDAIPYFKKAVKSDPSFALAHLYLAQAAPTAQEFFDELSRARKDAPTSSRGEQLFIEGFTDGTYGKPADQLSVYEELARLYPDDERAQTLVGTACFATQDYENAADHLNKAIALESSFAPAYNMLGYSYRQLEKYTEAEQTFKKYTELLPADPNPFDSYAEMLMKMGKFDESIAQYGKALSLNPNFPSSFAGIAACLMYEGKHDEALAEIQKALNYARNDGEKRGALFVRAVVYQDQGKTEAAIGEIEKEYAIAEKTSDKASMAADLGTIANILINEGKADEALAKYRSADAIIEKSTLAKDVKEFNGLIAHYNYTWVFLGKGNIAAAEKEAAIYRKGAEARKNANQIRFAHELAGMVAFHKKDFAGAADELKQANQQDARVLYNIALAYQGAGKPEDARRYASMAAKFNGLPGMRYAFVRMKAEKLLQAL